ncbi:MAG: HlyD family efflux transporter periplasmic adaptor subunit [Hyphomicrobium sp.]
MSQSEAVKSAVVPRLDISLPLRLGILVITLFFVFGIGGAALAPIDKGVGLPGTIIVESKVKPAAHLAGGLVREVRVVEGQEVNEGDVIVTLNTDILDQQMIALRAQASAAERQLDLARQESATVDDLERRKLAATSKALALRRMVAEIEKEVASVNARIAASEGELERAQVKAPVSGRILTLNVHAAGAVVQPGETVAEIVPRSDRLVIEGHLQPNQIENVVPGMPAKVWLTALNWREQRPMAAKLAWISPDSVEDKRTGAPYFVARVELEADSARNGPSGHPVPLQPGMRAEVLLLTGQRTLLDQLIDPLMRNVHKAFNG